MFNQFGGQQYGYNHNSMPYLPDYSKPQQPQSNVSWVYVNGIEGAKSQIVQPGQTSWMMDNSDPVIYVKAVDTIGTTTFKAFRLSEINAQNVTTQNNVDLSEYVHKSEIDSILSRLGTLEDLIGGLNA